MPFYQPDDFSNIFGSGEGQIDPKFAAYAPQYDDWQETYIQQAYDFAGQEYGIAQDLYGLAGERYGMAQERSLFEQVQRGDARTSAQERLDMQMMGMGQQMGGTLSGAQEQVFDILGQGEQMGAGGLGTRSGMTRRAMRSIEGSTERALAGQAMTGLEAKSQYESTLGDIAASAFGSAQSLAESGLAYEQAGLSLEASGIEYGRAGMQYGQAMDELAADWEDEMYDYLLMLGTEFDEWGSLENTDNNNNNNNNNGILDPEYDEEGGSTTEGNHIPTNPNFDPSTWGPGNPYYDQNPDLDYWQGNDGGYVPPPPKEIPGDDDDDGGSNIPGGP